MAKTLLFELPELPVAGQADTAWWRIVDGAVVESGTGAEWLEDAPATAREGCRLVALAPAALVRLFFTSAPAGANPRQAAAAARMAAIDACLGDPQSLHAVSRSLANEPQTLATAVVDNGRMLEWLDWAASLGADPHHVVPVALLLPRSEDWVEGQIGSQRLVGRAGRVFLYEPQITEALVGDAHISPLDQAELGAAIGSAASVPLDLRTGRFARRRRIAIDPVRIRELAVLAALIPLIGLLWSLVSIAKVEKSTERLNEQTLAIAEAALGRPTTLETVEGELAQQYRAALNTGPMAPLSAIYEGLQSEQSVSVTQLNYGSDGTLSVTLAAPVLDPVNRVLVALQRSGYRITAVPRQSPDGRAMVDATVRSSL